MQVLQRGICADQILRALGVRWTLCPQLFAHPGGGYKKLKRHAQVSEDVLLIRNALPGELRGHHIFIKFAYEIEAFVAFDFLLLTISLPACAL